MIKEQDVAAHYRHGALERRLMEAIRAAGIEADPLTPDDLLGADEFHVGAAQATAELASQLHLTSATHVLDVGCGLGGPARHIAATYGCRVTGVDLSDEYVQVASSLAKRMNLTDRVDFRQGNATDLPFADGSFDRALLLHVGMNIADKGKLFAGVRRILRSGGLFAVYDVMRVGAGDLVFPLPWSSVAETTALESPDAYRALLSEAGFEVVSQRDRCGPARRFFAVAARQLTVDPPPLGMRLSQIILGASLPAKIANMITLLDQGVIAPIEMVARRTT